MKSIIIFAVALVAVAIAAPSDLPPQILNAEYEQNPDGGYTFGFDTENGIHRKETGELKSVLNEKNEPVNVLVVRGKYDYTDKDGNVETISYFADENGFQAEGPSVPKVPESRR